MSAIFIRTSPAFLMGACALPRLICSRQNFKFHRHYSQGVIIKGQLITVVKVWLIATIQMYVCTYYSRNRIYVFRLGFGRNAVLTKKKGQFTLRV